MREVCASWGLVREVVDDIELLVSELVTNAVLHARSAARLTIEHFGDRIRVTVSDSSSVPPRLRDYGPEAATGRGVFLVDRLARGLGRRRRRWRGQARVVRDRGRARERRVARVNAAAMPPATTDVVLAGCPIDLLERSRRHNESLMREFAFIADSDEERAELPARLLALVDRARARLVGLNVAVEEQLAAARARGDDTCDLRVTLPSNGRALAVELAEPVRRRRGVLPPR